MASRNRMTLLDIVQRVLDAMNHDSVNSINATVEARQIAEEARVTYYDLMDRDDWSHLMQYIQLEGLSVLAKPNWMKIPLDAVRIQDIRYEVTEDGQTQRRFREVCYLTPEEFLDLTLCRNSEDENVVTVQNPNKIDMFILNNKAAEYWTSFDDEHVIFDSFDSAVETTMHGAKSLAYAKVIPEWRSEDTFVPDMPEQMFSVYLAEVTAAAFLYWKQGTSPKDEQRAARGISRLRKDARKIDEYKEKASYGRRRPGNYNGSADGHRGSIRAQYYL